MITQEIVNFSNIAKNYCHLVETASQYPLTERVIKFAILLAELYSTALHLPELEPTNREVSCEPSPVTGWTGFDEFDEYWEIFDPYEVDKPISTTVTDDLLDIYYDIKLGLLMFERGSTEDMADAVWNWRFNFNTHWGNHLVDALRTLHRAIQQMNGIAKHPPLCTIKNEKGQKI